jgi:hypothetical protein
MAMNKRMGLIATGLVVLLAAGGGTALAAASGPAGDGGVINGCYTNAELDGSHALFFQDAGTSCPKNTTAIAWNEQGPQGATGAPGTGATVTSLASGDTNCPNGGAQVTDGSGDTAYACNGATGPTGAPGMAGEQGPPGTQGQQGIQGPPGVGTAGSDGLNITIVSGSQSVPVGSYGSPIAWCPAAEPYVLSGGGGWGSLATNGQGPNLQGSMPIVSGGPVTGPESSSNANGWSADAFNDGATQATDTLYAWAVCSD